MVTTNDKEESSSSSNKVVRNKKDNHEGKKHKMEDKGNSDEETNSEMSIELTDEEREEMKRVTPYLLMRSYHLPGYTWAQDWFQYMTNNHPLFGICCHHRFHPVGMWMRLAALLGSTMFGLAITNIVYLVFVFTNQNYEYTYVEVPAANITTHQAYLDSYINDSISNLTPSNGNIALWTVGACIHSFYDNTIWAIAAWAWDGDVSQRMKRYQSNMRNFFGRRGCRRRGSFGDVRSGTSSCVGFGPCRQGTGPTDGAVPRTGQNLQSRHRQRHGVYTCLLCGVGHVLFYFLSLGGDLAIFGNFGMWKIATRRWSAP